MATPDTLPDWRRPSDYAALLRAGRGGFAWEFLRRNARYRSEAVDATQPIELPFAGGGTRLRGGGTGSVRWGLDFPGAAWPRRV
jgi:hypothetical protein